MSGSTRSSRKSIGGRSAMSAMVQAATTPGADNASVTSARMIRPFATGERTTRMWSCDGNETSAANRPRPTTSGASSRRATEAPITWLSDGFITRCRVLRLVATLVRREHCHGCAGRATHRRVRADTERRQQIHLGAERHVGARRLRPQLRMLELAGVLMDDHVLKDVERAGDVLERNAVGREHAAQVFGAAVRRHFGYRPSVGFLPEPARGGELMPLSAAHAFLQVVVAFEGVLQDRHQGVVELRDQEIA